MPHPFFPDPISYPHLFLQAFALFSRVQKQLHRDIAFPLSFISIKSDLPCFLTISASLFSHFTLSSSRASLFPFLRQRFNNRMHLIYLFTTFYSFIICPHAVFVYFRLCVREKRHEGERTQPKQRSTYRRVRVKSLSKCSHMYLKRRLRKADA